MEQQPSCRAALGALASVTALATMPAAAVPSTTQLSALIDAHRAARAAFNEAIDALEVAEPDEETVLPGIIGESRVNGSRQDTIAELIESNFEIELRSVARISSLSPALGEQARAVLEARKTLCLGRLEEVFAEYSVAETAYNDASATEDDAIMAICAYRCASIEEAAVRARYIRSSPIEDELQRDHVDALFASFLPEGELDAA